MSTGISQRCNLLAASALTLMLATPTVALAAPTSANAGSDDENAAVSATAPEDEVEPEATDEPNPDASSTAVNPQGVGDEPIEDPEPEKPHPVTNLTVKSTKWRTAKLSWTAPDGYVGDYTVYRVSGDSLKKVATTKKNSYTVKNLTAGKTYQFAIKTDEVSKTVSVKVISQKNASLSLVKSGSSRWDVRKAAKQKLKGFDTIQGACAYKGYAYFALYNRNVERIRVAKVRLKTMKVVKVSRTFKTHYHGGTLSYDSKRKRLIATCGDGGKNKVLFIDPSKLKETGTKTFNISSTLIGERYRGISSLFYVAKSNCYVAKLRGNSCKIVRFSSSLKSPTYVPTTKNDAKLFPQSLYAEGDYMYNAQSFSSTRAYNMITIRTLEGGFVGKLKLSCGSGSNRFELENLFHDETTNTWYVSFYRSVDHKDGRIDRRNYLYKVKNLW